MTATIFTPQDTSIEARVAAWKQVYQANEQLQASLDLHSEEWQDRLGEQADRQFAQQTIMSSLNQASASLSQDELQQAQQRGLLSKKDVQAIVISQRTQKSQHKSQDLSRSRSRTR